MPGGVVHAHAQTQPEADMFAGTAFAPAIDPINPIDRAPAGPLIEFDGVLLRNAEVRTKPASDGLHSVPVVHVELASMVSGVKRVCSADIHFTDATRQQAEALALSLTRHRAVTVTAPIAGMRVCFGNAASINLHQEH
jgi:hypothetical protein